MSDEAIQDCDDAALGVPAIVLTLVDGVVVARCQAAADALWFCRKVVQAHEVPEQRTVN